ncbi:hypothetical protein [uncultured Alistipes sp.]|uniref:hypothetical protein n=1 Tax=uncultured Alistipes sp. TaxID=538949 RepID=UPI0026273A04|nr:hypothetical protein [uncultured Alistipes sp.]
MKFDITRQPLVPAFLTLAALTLAALYAAGASAAETADITGTADRIAELAVAMPRELLTRLQAIAPAGSKTLTAFLLLFAGMCTGRMTVRYNLYSAGTCLAIPLFGMVACGLAARTEYLPACAATALLALAVKNFGRSFCNGYGFDAIFRASLYLGMIPLLVPAAAPLLLLMPVALMLFRRTVREAAVALAGILLPPLVLCYVNWGAGGSFIAPVALLGKTLVTGAPFGMLLSLPLPEQLMLGATVVLTLLALGLFLSDLYAVGTRPRFLLVFAACTFAATLLALCSPAATTDDTLLVAVPAAVLLPVLFVRTRRLINLPLYLLLLAGAAAVAFLQ